MRLKTYYSVWKIMAYNALQEAFVNRWSNALFFLGKLMRFAMTLVVLLLIQQNVSSFGEYSVDHIIVFYLTYQFVDTLAQVFYRGVYLFSNQVRSGEFDFLLSKPINPLFQALTGRPDVNDAFFLIPTIAVSIYLGTQLQLDITLSSLLWYGVLLINSVLIVTALHIMVLALGILTTEVDGVVWMYRDLVRLGQFPVTIYLEPIRFLLFFLVPVGMMITIPAQILTNSQPSYAVLTAFLVGAGFFLLSLFFWNWSLKRYASASS